MFLNLNTWRPSFIALVNEVWSAIPWPAISKPVPWSGEVLTTGNPAVKFIPFPKEIVLNGVLGETVYYAIRVEFQVRETPHVTFFCGPKAYLSWPPIILLNI